jgi:hypothetical protein
MKFFGMHTIKAFYLLKEENVETTVKDRVRKLISER